MRHQLILSQRMCATQVEIPTPQQAGNTAIACSGAHGVQQKMYNWNTLNQRVFKKLDFVLAKRECEAVVNCDPGAVERVLKLVKVKVEAYTEKQSQKPRSARMLLPLLAGFGCEPAC